jgi:CRISPR-associated endonuclease Cas2
LKRIPVLILYDISDDSIRNRLSKELLYYGCRTQKSLFEAEVSEGELKELKKIVDSYAELDPSNSVNLYILTPNQYRSVIRLGPDDSLTIDDFVI